MRVLNLPALIVQVKQNLLSNPETTNEEFLNFHILSSGDLGIWRQSELSYSWGLP